MSDENVELVRRFLPPPDVDMAALFRNDDLANAMIEAAMPVLDPDFECVMNGVFGQATYVGLTGLRDAWRDWLEPWASYRTEIDNVIDVDNRVVVLVHDFGRLHGDAPEVSVVGANIWTLRDGRVTRIEFFPDRDVALRTAGLAKE